MTKHKTGTRKKWLVARLDLLKAEHDLPNLTKPEQEREKRWNKSEGGHHEDLSPYGGRRGATAFESVHSGIVSCPSWCPMGTADGALCEQPCVFAN
jgi:hypothetical protein